MIKESNVENVQIHCFIASAFGYSDVDKIYDQGITDVLSKLNIIPHRVDRENHNNDIDDKIIELMNTCDICIADLTYSRPSVYYEAGYFKGLGKEVIFTVRNDHFKPKENDIFGNYRVHFDLQMKNIIAWNEKDNISKFKNKLQSRLKLICEPIWIKQKQDYNTKLKNEEFKKLSPIEKKSQLLEVRNNIFNNWKKIKPDLSINRKPQEYFVVKQGTNLFAIFLTQSATKEYLKYIKTNRIAHQNYKELNEEDNCHLIIISLRKIPQNRIEDLYPEFKIINEQIVSYSSPYKEEIMKNYKVNSYIHFISGLQNLDEYEVRLKMISETY